MLNQKEYSLPHCYQYQIRLQNKEKDLHESGIKEQEARLLRVSDFDFSYVPKEETEICQKIKEFIQRHKWLGSMPHRPTHRFIATYKGMIAGVIVMATPNAFSNLLGKENRDLEKLISRGACISWSPKNLASALIMYSIRWMVKNTSYRFFTAYSDVEARELGTVYQACNFLYLGQNSGARFEYFDPRISEEGFSDRIFRKSTSFKFYARNLGINWEKAWNNRDKILWENIPEDIRRKLKDEGKRFQESCERRKVPRKHKYVYILGKTKTESKKLLDQFKELNPTLSNLPYPKVRGPIVSRPLERPLTGRLHPCWPLVETKNLKKRFFSIKEVSAMYGISQWLIYHHIKPDPTFPFVNVGIKKKLLIEPKAFEEWLSSRTRKQIHQDFNLPSARELLEVA